MNLNHFTFIAQLPDHEIDLRSGAKKQRFNQKASTLSAKCLITKRRSSRFLTFWKIAPFGKGFYESLSEGCFGRPTKLLDPLIFSLSG